MRALRYLRSLATTLFHRGDLDSELDEELRAHIEQQADDLERSGLPAPKPNAAPAWPSAPMKRPKKPARTTRRFRLETLWSDARFALRMLRKNPGFTAVAILTLALGIGANTAIFQLLDAARLRALPVSNPQNLAEVRIAGGNHGIGLNQDHGELTRPCGKQFATNNRFSPERSLGASTSAMSGGAPTFGALKVFGSAAISFRCWACSPGEGDC